MTPAERLSRFASEIAQDGTVPANIAPGGSAPVILASGVPVGTAAQLDFVGPAVQIVNGVAVIETTAGPGTHPDLLAHTTLGLAPEHAHDFAAPVHEHDAAYLHPHPFEDAGAVAAHVAGLDAHPAYMTAAEGSAAYEASGAVTAHAGALDPHPAYVHPHPYAATSHAHLDADIPAEIARGAEVTSAVAVHAATPHGGGTWTTVIKTADESKNSLATVADDALLKFSTLANTSYTIRLQAFFLTNATADLKYRLVHTGTTTRVRRRVRRTATTDIAQTIVLASAFDVADVILSTTGLNPWLEEDVILQVGATPGVFKLQWSQVTSNAGPTTCLEGSYLEYALT